MAESGCPAAVRRLPHRWGIQTNTSDWEGVAEPTEKNLYGRRTVTAENRNRRPQEFIEVLGMTPDIDRKRFSSRANPKNTQDTSIRSLPFWPERIFPLRVVRADALFEGQPKAMLCWR